MVYDYFDKYTFLCEIEDDTRKRVLLCFFPFDNSVQVIDPDKGKNLIKRVQIPHLRIEMLWIGNILNIFSRQLLILDCVPATRRTLYQNYQSTFVLIKPVPTKQYGKIITFITKKGFRIVRMKHGKLDKDSALKIYAPHAGRKMMATILSYVTSGEVVGLELVAPNAVRYMRECLGATDPKKAAPGTLRALYGENILRNVAHACVSEEDAAEMLEVFFGVTETGKPKIPNRATLQDCTCCIIKPHAVLDGHVGAILDHITAGDKFEITAMAMFTIEMVDSQEFYEIYKGVLTEYHEMYAHLSEGKCIVLEIKCIDPNPNLNSVIEFRKWCGPRAPELCRQLYPDSLRALYGKNIVHNAVHCTDLPEDGVAEVEYFFKLQKC